MEKYKDLTQKRPLVLLLGSLQFCFLTLLAMTWYPGGDKIGLGLSSYDFFHNYLSDLGAFTTPSGAINYPAASLFFIAVNGLGFSMIYFYRGAEIYIAKCNDYFYLCLFSKLSITLSGIGFIGVGFFPLDLFHDEHALFAKMAFGFLAIYAASVSFMQWLGSWPFKYQWVNMGYVLIVSGYVLVLIMGPSSDTLEGLTIQVTMQKLVTYASALNIAYQVFGILKETKKVEA